MAQSYSTHLSDPSILSGLNLFGKYVNEQMTAFKADTENKLSLIDYLSSKLYSGYGIQRHIVGDLYQFYYNINHSKFDPNNPLTQFFKSVVFRVVQDENHQIVNMYIVALGVPQSSFDIFYPDSATPSVQELVAGTMVMHFNGQLATRKNIGTAGFNGTRTFAEHFDENNEDRGNSFKNLPDSLSKDTGLVFNVCHPDEHKCGVKGNTLVMAYKFKSEPDSLASWARVMNSPDEFQREEALKDHFSDMAVALELEDVQRQLEDAGCGHIDIPKTLKFDNFGALVRYVDAQPYTFQGVCMWMQDGSRVNYKNPAYQYVRDLAGNTCIQTQKKNESNLFFLFLRHYKMGSLEEFYRYYDRDGVYKRIFASYQIKLNNFISKLFNEYQDAHPRRKKSPHDIPFYLKDLCYILHGMHIGSNPRVRITPDYVRTFVLNMDNRIYGRIFTPLLEAPQKAVVETSIEGVDSVEVVDSVEDVDSVEVPMEELAL
jgi:hypothetical protein